MQLSIKEMSKFDVDEIKLEFQPENTHRFFSLTFGTIQIFVVTGREEPTDLRK